jgi:hypothetical protein
MTHETHFAVNVCASAAMLGLIGCATISHVAETPTTRQYDTTDPSARQPAASSKMTTTQYSDATVQRTYTQPVPYTSADQSTTVVTTNPNGGTVQNQTTTTYTRP